MKSFFFICQGVIQIFVGVGAVVCGALLILYPSGAPLQMSLEMLKDSPFYDFLIPGIILFLVNGIGQLLAARLTIRRHPNSGYFGAALGIGLMIWIFIQVNMIGGRNILQYIYFMLGTLEASLSLIIQNYLSARSHTNTPSKSN